MKKLLIIVAVLLLLVIAGSYAFLPNTIKITSSATVNCAQKNILTCVNDVKTWRNWWPADSTTNRSSDSSFKYNHYHFKITEPFTDGAAVELSDGRATIPTRILLIPIVKDSFLVTWEANFPTTYNPLMRISRYLFARSIKKSFDELLTNVTDYARQTKNIYGFTILRTTFRHTFLLASKSYSNDYPSTDMIYKKIDTIQHYLTSQSAVATDPPMINIQTIDSNLYEYMVAIPVDKKITAGPNMFISQMVPMEGRFLETMVKGGPITLQQAHEAISSFMQDRMLTPPAIPFEMMITDRRSETDTSKWMTKIYYPTMWN